MSTTPSKATQRKLNPVPDEPANLPENRSITKDEAMALAVVGTVIGAVVGTLAYFGWKTDKAKQAKLEREHRTAMAKAEAEASRMQAWFDRVRKDGKIVIETVDGEYMAVPAEAYAKSEIMSREA